MMKYSIPNFEVSALLFHDKNCRIFQAAVFQIKELMTFFGTLSLEVEFYFLNHFVHQIRSLKLVFFQSNEGCPSILSVSIVVHLHNGKMFQFYPTCTNNLFANLPKLNRTNLAFIQCFRSNKFHKMTDTMKMVCMKDEAFLCHLT